MKTYKLKWYHPYWINNDEIINYYQIDELLEKLVAIPNPWEEIKTNNYNWTDILFFECYHKLNDNIEYIKIEQNKQDYYYKFIKKDEIGTIDKNGELIVKYYFELDEWNTYINELFKLLLKWNCIGHFKQVFLDRLLRLNNKYVLNFTLQKYLKDIIPLPNITNKRKYVNGTNGNKIYELNEPIYTINNLPNYQLYNWATNEIWNFDTKEWFGSDTNMNGDNHRYCYWIVKTSAMRKINNEKDLSTNTSQKIIIIPLVPSHKDEILHAINDIGVTIEQNSCLIIGDNNTISSKLTEAIPYAVLFDWYLKNTDKAEFKYAVNKVDNNPLNDVKIPFFLINFNEPILLKIFDYLNTNSTEGIGKRIRDFINNLDKLLPYTEPLMLNPFYYYEMYNNGLTQYSVSFEDLHLEFNKNIGSKKLKKLKNLKNLENITLQAYFNFFSGIDMSFYFGELTNIYNSSLDNTNTKTIDIGIPFGLASGASAKFLENDISAGYTGLLNRQNEKGQRIADATFDSAILAADIMGNVTSTTGWLNPGKTSANIVKDTIKIAKTITDSVMTEQRADNSFYGSIKSSIQAPNNITTTPYSKASIPLPNIDGNYLMNMYAILPVEQCADKIFINYLHEGYVYDAFDNINKCINRKFMNVLHIAANDTKEDILNIWEREYNNKVFKNKFWFTRALSFLSSKHKLYMTSSLVNCTNHKGNAYVHNIEIESYNIETIKININTLIENYLNVAPKYLPEIKNLIIENNPNLLNYQNDIEIQCDYKNSYIVINAKENSNLMGQVVFNTFFYTATIRYENEPNKIYYIESLSDLCPPFSTNNTPYETWDIKAYTENIGIVSLKIGNIGNNFYLEINSNIDNSQYIKIRDIQIAKGFCAWCKIIGNIIIPNWYITGFGNIRFNDYAFFNTKNNTIIILNTTADVFMLGEKPQFTFTKNFMSYREYTTIIICKTQEQVNKLQTNFPILPNEEFPTFNRNIVIELENE